MGWSVGWDPTWQRDIGYGVPAFCDLPACTAEIDRGLAYVCGGEPYGGEHGCGLFFCGEHLFLGGPAQQCIRCVAEARPFAPSPDHPDWISHKLTDESWARWRGDNPAWVAQHTAPEPRPADPWTDGGTHHLVRTLVDDQGTTFVDGIQQAPHDGAPLMRNVSRYLAAFAVGALIGLGSYYLAHYLGAGRHLAGGIGGGVAAFTSSRLWQRQSRRSS